MEGNPYYLELKERVKNIGEKVAEHDEDIRKLQDGASSTKGDIALIKQSIDYIKTSTDEVKAGVKNLQDNQVNDHYIIPKNVRDARKEKILTVVYGIIAGGVLVTILGQLFPMINW